MNSDPDTWRQRLDDVRRKMAPFENMDSPELARLFLGNVNVDFPGRKEWEEQLFHQKQLILNLMESAGQAFQEFHQTREVILQIKDRTKGEEERYELAKKKLELAIRRAQMQGDKLENIINDGKKRAEAWKGK